MTERVRLHESNEERDRYDRIADLYSMIVAIERVERAYFKSSMSPEDYTKQCNMLLQKFKSLYKVVESTIGSLEEFLAAYRMSCQYATDRIVSGRPATEEGSAGTGEVARKDIRDATESMITAMDALKMAQTSADDLHPYLADVVQQVSKVFPRLPELSAVSNWLRHVNNLKASDELDASEVRQCVFDLNRLYKAFGDKLDESSAK
ncbi:Vacuolar protein sorting-associated protein 28 [Diplonema papillatum]|nr:Vacuolar protein sorting-associated protein 28 [Diplonema papillatum]KAJ9463031.1 Vacuolar protein sorting-associated protein 28 [Diplonema papillatum]